MKPNIEEIYNTVTDLWYATVSPQKKGCGHPGVSGPSSSDKNWNLEIGHLEGIERAIQEIIQAKKEMMNESHNTENKPEESKYIGDGVYASFDGYQIWLAVNDHRNKVVALEPDVFKGLVAYAEKLKSKKIY